MSKKIGKYVPVFDYINQALIALSTTNGGVSTISFKSFVGASVGIASASLALFFSLITGIVKKINEHNKKQNEKA